MSSEASFTHIRSIWPQTARTVNWQHASTALTTACGMCTRALTPLNPGLQHGLHCWNTPLLEYPQLSQQLRYALHLRTLNQEP